MAKARKLVVEYIVSAKARWSAEDVNLQILADAERFGEADTDTLDFTIQDEGDIDLNGGTIALQDYGLVMIHGSVMVVPNEEQEETLGG
ncbi:hypothetical protein [Mycobacterium phage PP]|uniref:Uncharacterized protein n=1 Tax=Mycobacterium phage PP TaxID=2077134 RepID=A0A2Z5XVF9_9CAUD|nr:hypothetical protein KIW36_gp52 [Mycobacterium phage PP]BBC53839.1 hypothetical protein [Mycobacterium phage PP]